MSVYANKNYKVFRSEFGISLISNRIQKTARAHLDDRFGDTEGLEGELAAEGEGRVRHEGDRNNRSLEQLSGGATILKQIPIFVYFLKN
jgi:hypothetical protein